VRVRGRARATLVVLPTLVALPAATPRPGLRPATLVVLTENLKNPKRFLLGLTP